MAPQPKSQKDANGKRKRPTLPSLKPSRAQRPAPTKKPTRGGDDGEEEPDPDAKPKYKYGQKPKPDYPRGPRSNRPRAEMRKKKAGSDAESEGSGYEEVKVDEEGYSSDEGDSDSEDNFGGGRRGGRGGDSSEDDGFDITDALAGNLPSSSKKGKERAKLPSQDAQFHQAGGKKKNSSYIPGMPESEDDEGDVSDADLIVEMMEKRNVKDGKAVVKSAVAKKGDNGKGMKEATGGGSFPTMGLLPSLLKSIMKKYKTPTPIQRLAIPAALSTPPRDIVAMSRTGSGKTLAYVAPLIQRLHGRHSSTFGARAIVLCPSRELAVQILKVGKEMARGFKSGGGKDHAGDDDDEDDKRNGGNELRWGLVVGGEGLDEQFDMISSNPDVIIATPGRLLHLVVEMNLDLRSVEYIVFDEADRLFEMGFEIQLQEILYRLPATRQTLLYSATLPKNLVEFAKAGLSNPRLIRLDAEAKISNDLQMSFFSVKPAEKEAALMSLLREVIGVPLKDPDEVVSEEEADPDDEERPRFGGGKGDYRGKGKGKPVYKKREKLPTQMAPHQTLVFAATKHHVDYLSNLLITAGYAVSHIYGSLDQTARKQQLDRFRRGRTSILVVTDVAARGIDIPVLENVINYDFPTGSRVFVHRVGRTARAGRKGAAWSFVTNTELPFFLDLQLFLGRSLVNSRTAALPSFDPASAIYLGTIPRDSIDADFEYIQTSLSESNPHLPILKAVVKKGQAMYERSQGKASQESYRRAKEMTKDPTWGLAGSIGEEAAVHPSFSASVSGHINPSNQTIFAATPTTSAVVKAQDPSIVAAARATLLASVNSFRPSETIFEIGNRGKNASFKLMQDRRNTLAKAVGRRNPELAAPTSVVPGADKAGEKNWDDEEGEMDANTEAGLRKRNGMDLEMADEDELEATFETAPKKKAKTQPTEGYKDPEFYMSHYQSGAEHDTKGYSMRDGASFAEQAKGSTMDLTGDDGITALAAKPSQLTWDRKKKKFVKGDGVGADNQKIVRTESGARLPATFKSGRFDEWKAKNKKSLPRVGDAEPENAGGRGAQGLTGADGRRFRHNKITEAKPLDKKSTTYERKVRIQEGKKRAAAEEMAGNGDGKKKSNKGGRGVGAAVGGRGGKSASQVKNEIRSVDQIKKKRAIEQKKKEKNARAPKKGKGGKGRK